MREVFLKMKPDEIDSSYLNGVYKDIANILGVEAAIALYSTYRGQQITFPVNFFTGEFIANQVLSEYDGHNVKFLATKYGYSEKWIRKIVKEKNEKY